MPTIAGNPLPIVVTVTGAVLRLIPENDKAAQALNAFFTAHGAKVVVAVTQAATPRDGLGETGGYYNDLILTLS